MPAVPQVAALGIRKLDLEDVDLVVTEAADHVFAQRQLLRDKIVEHVEAFVEVERRPLVFSLGRPGGELVDDQEVHSAHEEIARARTDGDLKGSVPLRQLDHVDHIRGVIGALCLL